MAKKAAKKAAKRTAKKAAKKDTKTSSKRGAGAAPSPALPAGLLDRLAIRELVENWAVWRDARMWDRFRTVWHPEGEMWATWFQGTYEEFIKVSQEGFDRGVRIMHFLGGMSIDIRAARAIAQTKMTISQRANVDGVLCDVVCTGRFYDFLEKRNGRWGLVLRRLAYEKDRLDPVDPAAKLELDQDLLAQFPEGYRHLAYLQTRIGYKVKRDMPGHEGPDLDALYAKGKAWLERKGR
jgi:SnoaL-like domain